MFITAVRAASILRRPRAHRRHERLLAESDGDLAEQSEGVRGVRRRRDPRIQCEPELAAAEGRRCDATTRDDG